MSTFSTSNKPEDSIPKNSTIFWQLRYDWIPFYGCPKFYKNGVFNKMLLLGSSKLF